MGVGGGYQRRPPRRDPVGLNALRPNILRSVLGVECGCWGGEGVGGSL